MLQLLAVLSLMAALLGLFPSSSFSVSAHASSSLSATSCPLGAPSAGPSSGSPACGDQPPGPRSDRQAAAPPLHHYLFPLNRSTSSTIELTAALLGFLFLPVSRASRFKGRLSSKGPLLAASLAFLLFLVTPVAPSAILDSYNTPARDFYSLATSASLTLWLQGSRSMPIHSGALLALLSPSRLALARTASRLPNHYAGHTLTIGAQSAVSTISPKETLKLTPETPNPKALSPGPQNPNIKPWTRTLEAGYHRVP